MNRPQFRARVTRCNKDKTPLVHYRQECFLTATYTRKYNFIRYGLPKQGCWLVQVYICAIETYKGFAEEYYITNGKRVKQEKVPC